MSLIWPPMVCKVSGNGEAEGRWLLRMQEYKPGYGGDGRQSLGTMKQVEEQKPVRVEQDDLPTWDQEAQFHRV